MTTAPSPWTEEEVERAARAMEPRAFEVFDAGYTCRNYFEERAFLNAEKVVKRVRKKAALALSSLPLQRAGEGWEKALIEAWGCCEDAQDAVEYVRRSLNEEK